MTKNCPNCGNTVRINARFCERCGFHFPEQNMQGDNEATQMINMPQQGMQPQQQPPYQIVNTNPRDTHGGGGRNDSMGNYHPENRDKNKNNMVILATIAAALVIVALVIWVFVFGSDQQEPSYTNNQPAPVETPAPEITTTSPAMPASSAQSETAPAATTIPETPQMVYNGKMYLKGTVNGKYGVTMMLNLRSGTGKYCYTKYGPKNSMELSIDNLVDENNPTDIDLREFDPDGMYCGEWKGTIKNGVFSGTGIYLNKRMPFSLKVISPSQSPY